MSPLTPGETPDDGASFPYDDAEWRRLALAAGAIIGTWLWDVPADRFTVDERFAETFGIDPARGREGRNPPSGRGCRSCR